MKAAVSAVHDNGEIVQLLLIPSAELLVEQARAVAACVEQVPFAELHITLASSTRSDKPLRAPPAHIEFVASAERVARSDKASVYLRVSDASHAVLAQYVAELERDLGVTGLRNPARVFHVSLSNRVGTPRGSIARIWDLKPFPV